MHTQWPHYLSERFPTEVRATATGFCYHQGAIFGGLVGPVLTYFATDWHMGFAIPMMIGTIFAAVLGLHRDGVQSRNEGHGIGRGYPTGVTHRQRDGAA